MFSPKIPLVVKVINPCTPHNYFKCTNVQSIKFKLVDTNVVNFKTCTVTQQGLTNFLKFYLVIKVLYNLFYKELISIRGLT